MALAGPLTLLHPARIYRFCPQRPPAPPPPDPRPRCSRRVPQLPAQHVRTWARKVALGAEGVVREASAPSWPRLLTGQVPSWKLHLPFPIPAELRSTHARAFSRLGSRGLALAGPGRLPAGGAPGASVGLRTRRAPSGWAAPPPRVPSEPWAPSAMASRSSKALPDTLQPSCRLRSQSLPGQASSPS